MSRRRIALVVFVAILNVVAWVDCYQQNTEIHEWEQSLEPDLVDHYFLKTSDSDQARQRLGRMRDRIEGLSGRWIWRRRLALLDRLDEIDQELAQRLEVERP